MNIVVWSDFLCPYCLLGKARLMVALERAGIADAAVEVRSFLLNPGRSLPGVSMRSHLMEKYGYTETQVRANFASLETAGRALGLNMDLERAHHAGTDAAHALFQYAKANDLGTAFSDRLQRAAFCEGADLGDEHVLLAMAQETGLKLDGARAALLDPAYFARARDEYRDALRLNVRGVPFFLFNGRLSLSGAVPVESFEAALGRAAGQSAAAAERKE